MRIVGGRHAEADASVHAAWAAARAEADGGDLAHVRRLLVRNVIARAAATAGADASASDDDDVAASRFHDEDDRWNGHWKTTPQDFEALRPDGPLATPAHATVERALAGMPLAERTVVTLRDVARWSVAEIGDAIGADAELVRALLQDGRSRVARALARVVDERPA